MSVWRAELPNCPFPTPRFPAHQCKCGRVSDSFPRFSQCPPSVQPRREPLRPPLLPARSLSAPASPALRSPPPWGGESSRESPPAAATSPRPRRSLLVLQAAHAPLRRRRKRKRRNRKKEKSPRRKNLKTSLMTNLNIKVLRVLFRLKIQT